MKTTEVSFALPTYDSLKQGSLDFHVRHGVSEYELDLSQEIVKAFHKDLATSVPRPGDLIIIKDPHGNILRAKAHLDFIDTERAKPVRICDNTEPTVPFVDIGQNDKLKFDTSGGPWRWCSLSDLKATNRKTMKRFKAWGRHGYVGMGAFYFDAPVKVWSLVVTDN